MLIGMAPSEQEGTLVPYIIALVVFAAAAGLFRFIAMKVGHLDEEPTPTREGH